MRCSRSAVGCSTERTCTGLQELRMRHVRLMWLRPKNRLHPKLTNACSSGCGRGLAAKALPRSCTLQEAARVPPWVADRQ